MKKSIKISVFSIAVFLILLFVTITVFAKVNNINTLAEARAYAESIFNAEQKAVLNELSDRSFNEILKDIKNIEQTKNADSDMLTYYHVALSAKMETASGDDITSAILDKSLSAASRSTILISAEENNIKLDYTRLASAVTDDNYEDIRPLLIEIVASESPRNINKIEEIVDKREKGFKKAITTLWETKPEKAIAVADEILNNYSGEYDEIFRGAFSVKSYQTQFNPTDKNCAEFIALCDKILNTSCDDEEGRRIYVISYLQEIHNKEILIYCKEKGFSELMGGPDLASTLEKVLSEPASVKNAELFLYFYPEAMTQSIWEAVNKHLADNKQFYKNNPLLKEKLENISAENYEIVSILSEPNEPRVR